MKTLHYIFYLVIPLLISTLFPRSLKAQINCDSLTIVSDTCSSTPLIDSLVIEFCPDKTDAFVDIAEDNYDVFACNTDSLAIRLINPDSLSQIFWSTGSQDVIAYVAPDIPTVHTIIAYDGNGCQYGKSFRITMEKSQAFTYEFNTDAFEVIPCNEMLAYDYEATICQGDSLEITVQPNENTTLIQWNTGEFTPTITVSPSENIIYATTIYDSNGIQHNLCVLVVVEELGSENCSTTSLFETIEEKIIAYPNPSNGRINIQKTVHESFDLEIIDMTGNLIFFYKDIDDNAEFDIAFLPSGVYAFKFINSNGEVIIKKIIINK